MTKKTKRTIIAIVVYTIAAIVGFTMGLDVFTKVSIISKYIAMIFCGALLGAVKAYLEYVTNTHRV